jgi:hypothetical protein
MMCSGQGITFLVIPVDAEVMDGARAAQRKSSRCAHGSEGSRFFCVISKEFRESACAAGYNPAGSFLP